MFLDPTFVFCLLVGMQCASFLCHTISALQPVNHGLNPLKLWDKINLSSIKLQRSEGQTFCPSDGKMTNAHLEKSAEKSNELYGEQRSPFMRKHGSIGRAQKFSKATP